MWTSAPPSSSARHFFAGRGLHERRAAQKDRAGALDDDRFVRHRRHVGAAGGARAHDDRDLRDPLGRHARLVEEDAAEVLAVGKDLGLQRQKGAAGIDEVDARQAVLERDLLRAQVLLDGDREVRAAFDRGVVGDDQHFAARDAADAGDEAGGRRLVVVHVERGERRQLEKRRAASRAAARSARAPAACPARGGARGTSGRRLRARGRAASRSSATSCCIRSRLLVKIGSEGSIVRLENDHYQPQQSVLKPQAGQRQTACMRYISAPHRSQSILSGSDRDSRGDGRGRSRIGDDECGASASRDRTCGHELSHPSPLN